MALKFELKDGTRLYKVYNEGYYDGLLMPHGLGFVYVKKGKFKTMKSLTLEDAKIEVKRLV